MYKSKDKLREYYREKYRLNKGTEWFKNRREKNIKWKAENKGKRTLVEYERRRKIRETWRGFIPDIAQCEMCGKDIYFSSGDKLKSINFDHRHGGLEAIKESPTNWLGKHRRTPEKEKIWLSCDFGMLCRDCNMKLPTENRQQFKINVNRYIK